jgi:membrane protein YdbS with pleckstrin-like domain
MFSVSVGRTPYQVAKLLLPYEQVVLTTRRHPASVGWPVAGAAAGLLAALVLSATVASSSGTAVAVLWCAWLVLLAFALWKYAGWWRTYFVATENRLLLKSGVLRTRVGTLPLGKVQDVLYDQSVTGRALRYATFTFETAGPDQALRRIEYIPFSDSLYLELMSLIFPDPNAGNGDRPEAPGDEPGP